METIGIKLEPIFLKNIEKTMKKHNYTTKTEFIREAIREKIKDLETEELLKTIDKLAGSSKHKTTDEDLHRARERLVKVYEKRFGIK